MSYFLFFDFCRNKAAITYALTLTGYQTLGTIPAPCFCPVSGSITIGVVMRAQIAGWHSVAISSLAFACVFTLGCRSPYYADRGAGLGALAGAGAGAIIGDATGGNAGTGALIGAGLGAVTGGVVGSEMDAMQAQNRAEIAAQMGRQIPVGAASIEEVVAMTQSGVDPSLIQNYVRTSGMARPLTAADVIYLHNQSVATNVIQIMQTPPAPAAMAQGQPVIVEEHYYGGPGWGPPPCWGPHYGYHRGPRCGPSTSFGISVVK